MIRHFLLITFVETVTAEQIDVVRGSFLQFPRQIDGVLHTEWGINDSPEGKNAAFTHSVMVTFRDEETRQRYLSHSSHEVLKAVFRPLIHTLVVFDYTLTQDNLTSHPWNHEG